MRRFVQLMPTIACALIWAAYIYQPTRLEGILAGAITANAAWSLYIGRQLRKLARDARDIRELAQAMRTLGSPINGSPTRKEPSAKGDTPREGGKNV